MSYRREHVEVNHFPGTKNITVRIEYSGELEKDEAIAKESMALLIGDALWKYCDELGLDPVKVMQMIDDRMKVIRSPESASRG